MGAKALCRLFIRFLRIKAKKAKRAVNSFMGDNYPVIAHKARYSSVKI